jgi:putative flippase GtrA
MAKKKLNKAELIERTCIRFGLLTAGTLVAFFLLMRVIGLAENVELWFLNLLIMMAGIVLAYKYLQKIGRAIWVICRD